MFSTKTRKVNLEGFTNEEAIAFMNNLAASPSFSRLTFGLSKDYSKLFVWGPRDSVDVLLNAIRSMSALSLCVGSEQFKSYV